MCCDLACLGGSRGETRAPSPLQGAGSDCLYPAGLRRLKPTASITQHQPGCGRYSGSIHRRGHVGWFERDCDGQRRVVDDSALDLPPAPFTGTASSSGLAQCEASAPAGTYSIWAVAPVDQSVPVSTMTMTTKQVSATGQLTCP